MTQTLVSYLFVKQAPTDLKECIEDIVDFEALNQEIEEAKVPNGELDTIFKKYCDRRGEAVECGEKYLKTIDNCLTPEERDQKVVAIKIVRNLLEFVCHKNGTQIARRCSCHF